MAAREVRAVVFDIGRVLIRIDVARAMNGLAKEMSMSLSPTQLWSAIEKDPSWKDWQEGRISPRDWHLHMNRRFGGTAAFEQFVDSWNLVLHPEPILGKDLFEKLAKKYRLALLSNTDPIHVAHMEAKYEFFAYFQHRIYSCSVGATKPSPIIFREALRACRVKAEEAVYIDDIAEFVEVARRMGMPSIQFQSAGQLTEAFRDLGLEV
jgi:FMN phosphatase YigB (HAD superfamily)